MYVTDLGFNRISSDMLLFPSSEFMSQVSLWLFLLLHDDDVYCILLTNLNPLERHWRMKGEDAFNMHKIIVCLFES